MIDDKIAQAAALSYSGNETPASSALLEGPLPALEG